MGRNGRTSNGRQRALVGLSVLGAANMAVISLRQLGVIDHLPDPPIRGFDADRVTSAPESYIFGIPDAPIEVGSLAANVPLALLAARKRTTHPWIPLLLGAKAVTESTMAGWYFWRMGTRIRTWCAYCILGAASSVAIAALALPDARRALPRTTTRARLAIAATIGAGLVLWMIGRGRGAPGST